VKASVERKSQKVADAPFHGVKLIDGRCYSGSGNSSTLATTFRVLLVDVINLQRVCGIERTQVDSRMSDIGKYVKVKRCSSPERVFVGRSSYD
jgi:hypothetical protein